MEGEGPSEALVPGLGAVGRAETGAGKGTRAVEDGRGGGGPGPPESDAQPLGGSVWGLAGDLGSAWGLVPRVQGAIGGARPLLGLVASSLGYLVRPRPLLGSGGRSTEASGTWWWSGKSRVQGWDGSHP